MCHGSQKGCDNKKECTHNDIVHFVFIDLITKVRVDLNPTLGGCSSIACKRVEPFRRAVVANESSKVYLPEVRIVKCLSSELIGNT